MSKIRLKDFGILEIPDAPIDRNIELLESYIYELETVNNILINIIRKQEKLLDEAYDI